MTTERGTVLAWDENNNPIDPNIISDREKFEKTLLHLYGRGTKLEHRLRSEKRSNYKGNILSELLKSVKEGFFPPLSWVVNIAEISKKIGLEPIRAAIFYSDSQNDIFEFLRYIKVNEYIILKCKKAIEDKKNVLSELEKISLPSLEEVLENISNER